MNAADLIAEGHKLQLASAKVVEIPGDQFRDLLAYVRECATDDLDRISPGMIDKAQKLLRSVTGEEFC